MVQDFAEYNIKAQTNAKDFSNVAKSGHTGFWGQHGHNWTFKGQASQFESHCFEFYNLKKLLQDITQTDFIIDISIQQKEVTAANEVLSDQW